MTLCACAWSGPVRLQAQTPPVQFPAPSPACTLKQRVGLTDIEVTYSRPSAKNRIVFGNVVPLGELWRTGANQATKITFSTPVKFNGADVPAGTYSLYTIPGANEWTVILNKNTGNWTPGGFDKNDDVARVTAKPKSLGERVETFTIDINEIRDESASLYLIWENVCVPVRMEVQLTSARQVEEAMAAPNGPKPYFQAAMFYYDHGLDLQKAKRWAEAAVAEREAYYTVHLKAKILAKLGEKEAAIAAAQRSTELAKAANDGAYVRSNEELLTSLK